LRKKIVPKDYFVRKMKRIFFLFFIFPLFAEERHILITLGENCTATAAIENMHLRKESYPFEFCITPFDALYSCLEDDFRHFVNPDYFTPYIDFQSPVNKYGICLAHSFPLLTIGVDKDGQEKRILDPEWRRVLPEVQAKYDRRITRFRQACTSGKKVYFLRYLGIEKNGAERLSNLIHARYPFLDFILICVNHQASRAHNQNWNIPRVKNYYIDGTVPKGDLAGWERIFKDVGLLGDQVDE
jgi:hypothetical protein